MRFIFSVVISMIISYFAGGESLFVSCISTSATLLALRILTGRGRMSFFTTAAAILVIAAIGDTLSYLIAREDLLPTLLNYSWLLFIPSLFFVFFGRGYATGWNRGATVVAILLFMLLTVIGVYGNTPFASSFYLLRTIVCGWFAVIYKTFTSLWYKSVQYSD